MSTETVRKSHAAGRGARHRPAAYTAHGLTRCTAPRETRHAGLQTCTVTLASVSVQLSSLFRVEFNHRARRTGCDAGPPRAVRDGVHGRRVPHPPAAVQPHGRSGEDRRRTTGEPRLPDAASAISAGPMYSLRRLSGFEARDLQATCCAWHPMLCVLQRWTASMFGVPSTHVAFCRAAQECNCITLPITSLWGKDSAQPECLDLHTHQAALLASLEDDASLAPSTSAAKAKLKKKGKRSKAAAAAAPPAPSSSKPASRTAFPAATPSGERRAMQSPPPPPNGSDDTAVRESLRWGRKRRVPAAWPALQRSVGRRGVERAGTQPAGAAPRRQWRDCGQPRHWLGAGRQGWRVAQVRAPGVRAFRV